MKCMRRYFNLCWEEMHLHKGGKIDRKTWDIWAAGTRDTLRSPFFQAAWTELRPEYTYGGHAKEFIAMIEASMAKPPAGPAEASTKSIPVVSGYLHDEGSQMADVYQTVDDPALVYQAARERWAHEVDIRWTVVTNFLLAATILLLAWASVFAGLSKSLGSLAVLVVLCLAGTVLSISTLLAMNRLGRFVRLYEELAMKSEEQFASGLSRPFHAGAHLRREARGMARFRSGWLLRIVPLTFVVTYVLLGVVSLLDRL